MAQDFTELAGTSFRGVNWSWVAWGDYDNDGDLDILLAGEDSIPDDVTIIYRNNGDNTFTEQTGISLAEIGGGSSALGDYDNDGNLDILLVGVSNGAAVSKVYKNNGNNSFTEQTGIPLTGVYMATADWVDYDNDGDLDIFLSGNDVNSLVSKIYRNNGNNSFTEQTGMDFTGVQYNSAAWGDYDNDGDMDILLTGWTVSGDSFSKIYKNNGNNSFTEQTGLSIVQVGESSVAWGDYDNDGDLDILLTGNTGSEIISNIYKNNGPDEFGFTKQTGISLTGVYYGSVAWGDYNNDGDLDILLTGNTGGENISKIYKNNGDNTFAEQTGISLTGVNESSVAWGDYDNDGDLDILLSGRDNSDKKVTKIYQNNSSISNTAPSIPSNLTSSVLGSSVSLSWNKSIDNETPRDGLTYNAYIYSENGDTVWSSMADIQTGYRRIPAPGNAQHDTSWTINNLEPAMYYWSVQAIDHGFSGSAFAVKDSFITFEGFTEHREIVPPGVWFDHVSWGDYDNDGDLDILLTGGWHTVVSLFKNNGNDTFTEQTGFPLSNITESFSAWGDYNNDGYLDILLAGITWTDTISRVYKNNGDNTFTEQTEISLTGVTAQSLAWGDCDNDGDLDILLTGWTGNDHISKLYKNTGAGEWGFNEETNISLPGIIDSSVEWGDYDNDGDLDILIAGSNKYGEKVTIIYENNGPGESGFTEQTGISLPGVIGSASWGDYDNDGDLDILICGSGTSSGITKIFKNNGDNTFSEQTEISLPGVIGRAVWGDYDNDGDLDILITGSYTGSGITKIYNNNGDNTFSEQTGIFLIGVNYPEAKWADYDNDGDLDIFLTGLDDDWTEVSRIYENNFPGSNTLPAPPTNLTSSVSGSSVTLSWNKSTDNETPQDGLTYNGYIYQAGGDNIMNSMSDIKTGFRKIPAIGNIQHNYTWTIDSLETGMYYWSIQAVDHSFAGSPFALEDSFSVVLPPNTNGQTICLGDSVPDLTAVGDSLTWYSDAELTILLYRGPSFSIGQTEPGVYTYYVTQKAYGLESDAAIVTLTIHDNPSTIFSDSTNISCHGLADGTAVVTPVGGISPYSFLWNDNGNTTDSTVTGLEANKWYQVIVTDSNGCSAIDSILLSEPEQLIILKDYSTRICPDSDSGYINLDVSGGIQPYSYKWSTGDTVQNVTKLPAGYYWVTVTDTNECSLTDTIKIGSISSYQDAEICMVTVNSANRIIVVWEKIHGEGIAYYNIYREQSKDNYVKIGTVPFNDLSIFVDESSVPHEYAHIYKISITDSCGAESRLSHFHKSVHLQANIGVSSNVNLNWDEYEGFDYYDYEIFRGTSPNSLNSIRTISANVRAWTDSEPLIGNNYYKIMVVKSTPCYPTGLKSDEYTAPFSNLDDETVVGLGKYFEGNLMVFPNPFTDQVTIRFSNPKQFPYQLKLMDVTGKVLRIVPNITENSINLKRTGLKNGIYMVELKGPNIYRSKLVVE